MDLEDEEISEEEMAMHVLVTEVDSVDGTEEDLDVVEAEEPSTK